MEQPEQPMNRGLSHQLILICFLADLDQVFPALLHHGSTSMVKTLGKALKVSLIEFPGLGHNR